MIRRTIDIKPADMAVFEKENKRLLLCLEEDNLLVTLIDKQNGEWTALENFILSKDDWCNMPETLQQIKEQSSLVNLKVQDTQLYYRTTIALPVPVIIKEDVKLFVQTQFGWQAPDEILIDEVDNTINVSMVIPESQITACRHIWPQATWNSTLALLIKQAQQVQGKIVFPQLFITLSTSLAEMVFMQRNELLVARCFHYYTPDNLLYHLLNTCHQLHISPTEVLIKAQGLLQEDDDVYVLLHQYFTHVEFITANTQGWKNAAFAELPAHSFTHLMVN